MLESLARITAREPLLFVREQRRTGNEHQARRARDERWLLAGQRFLASSYLFEKLPGDEYARRGRRAWACLPSGEYNIPRACLIRTSRRDRRPANHAASRKRREQKRTFQPGVIPRSDVDRCLPSLNGEEFLITGKRWAGAATPSRGLLMQVD